MKVLRVLKKALRDEYMVTVRHRKFGISWTSEYITLGEDRFPGVWAWANFDTQSRVCDPEMRRFLDEAVYRSTI